MDRETTISKLQKEIAYAKAHSEEVCPLYYHAKSTVLAIEKGEIGRGSLRKESAKCYECKNGKDKDCQPYINHISHRILS